MADTLRQFGNLPMAKADGTPTAEFQAYLREIRSRLGGTTTDVTLDQLTGLPVAVPMLVSPQFLAPVSTVTDPNSPIGVDLQVMENAPL